MVDSSFEISGVLYFLLVVSAVLCSLQAIRAHRLLPTTLWLAGVSVLTSMILFLLGAPEVAVIELSVGAGLVTVLFIFAISIAGEMTQDLPSLIPKPLAWGLFILAILLLGWLAWPVSNIHSPINEPSFTDVLWKKRALDVWVQIAIIFAGVLGILGLLAEGEVPLRKRCQQPPQEIET
jgi:uncharacterized MnhB-related membrane protein